MVSQFSCFYYMNPASCNGLKNFKNICDKSCLVLIHYHLRVFASVNVMNAIGIWTHVFDFSSGTINHYATHTSELTAFGVSKESSI